MRIVSFIRKTAGGRHAWYETDEGFRIRKPLEVMNILTPEERVSGIIPQKDGQAMTPKAPQVGWWVRLKSWFKKLWKSKK
jgi:hypothetical protein